MKRLIKLAVFLILYTFFTNSFPQGEHHGGYYDPDSLQIVTIGGFVIVDTTIGSHAMYYLNTDDDGTPDYILNFGPWWYQPSNSTANRPNDGEQIIVSGGLADTKNVNNYSVIVVYEINGEFWRVPYDPFWNHVGTYGYNHMMDSCHTSGFGWMHGTLETVSLSGYTIVDTTFIMAHYYLDEDNDGTPDYFLNFGPPWYEPASAATRPVNGDHVSIVGGILNNNSLPMVVVFEINGLSWSDSLGIGQHFGGGWVHRNMNNAKFFYTPFDTLDHITMHPDWWSNGGGHHGGMYDSLFCQILEIFPQDILHMTDQENVFAGYELDFFFPSMMGGGMNNQMGCGGHTNFNSNIDFQFHYTDDQLTDANIIESSIRVKYWDSDINQWKKVSDVTSNTIDNTISFNQSEAANFFILTGDSPTSVDNSSNAAPYQFILKQNYPNPFNPSTTIEFSLLERTKAKIVVSNIIGEKVVKLVDRIFNSGNYSVKFDGTDLPSGVYFYKMITDNFVQVKKMLLIK